MPGAILQLELQGAQNIYLISKPEITFFKTVYRKYSNFSIETKSIKFNDKPNFGSENQYVRILNNADLINRCYLKTKIIGTSDKNFKWSFVKIRSQFN